MTGERVKTYGFNIAWQAGRYNVRPKHIADVLYQISLLVGVFGTSETYLPMMRRIRKRVVRVGWRLRRKGEYAMGWKGTMFTPTGPGYKKRLTYVNRIAIWRDLTVHVQPLRHDVSEVVFCFIWAHFAAGVQGGGRYRTDRGSAKAVQTHKAGLENLRAHIDKIQKQHPEWVIVIGADLNVPMNDPAWRGLVTGHLGARSLYSHESMRDGGGTHDGGRGIDDLLFIVPDSIGLKVDRAKIGLIPIRGRFDHKNVACHITFWRKAAMPPRAA